MTTWEAMEAGGEAGAEGGGFVGAFFGPEGIPIGAAIGGVGGALAAGAAALWLSNHMANANQQSQSKTRAKAVAQACSTCFDCNKNQQKINNLKREVQDRYTEMRVDSEELYPYGNQPNPKASTNTTWEGHQTTYRSRQEGLRNALNDGATAGCDTSGNTDAWKWAHEKAPDMPDKYK